MRPDMTKSPIKEYREKHGLSLDGFAAKIAADLNKSTVSRWERQGVPAERVIDIERATGIPRERLRPDLYEAAE